MLLIVRMSYYRCSQGHISLNLCKIDLRKIVGYHPPTKFSHGKEFCVVWSYTVVWAGEDYLKVSPRHASSSRERVVLFLWIFTEAVQLASGFFLYHATFPSLSPTPFPSFPLLHSDYAWKDSGKARTVFGEPLTPDLWLVTHASLDFMFMPKWWSCRCWYGSNINVSKRLQLAQTLSC